MNLRNSIVEYDAKSNTSRVLENVRLRVARENHECLLSRDQRYVFVIGGWEGTSALGSIEILEFEDDCLNHVAFLDGAVLPRNRLCAALVD